jgi:hypothetical protein
LKDFFDLFTVNVDMLTHLLSNYDMLHKKTSEKPTDRPAFRVNVHVRVLSVFISGRSPLKRSQTASHRSGMTHSTLLSSAPAAHHVRPSRLARQRNKQSPQWCALAALEIKLTVLEPKASQTWSVPDNALAPVCNHDSEGP